MNRVAMTYGCSAALVGFVLAAPVGARAQTAADSARATIEAASRRFSAAYVKGDPVAMAALYTSDAVIFPGQSDRIEGRQAIARYWTLRPGRRVTRHVVTPASITIDGNHAYEYGIFEIAGEQDGAPWGPVRGKYVAVWRREGDVWRLHLDIWNSGPPVGP